MVLSYNVTSKNLFFEGNQELLGALTITDGTLKSDDAAEKLTVASISQSGGFINISNGEIECTGKADIDGKLTMSGGQFDINGELELSSTTTEGITDGTITVAGDFDGATANLFHPRWTYGSMEHRQMLTCQCTQMLIFMILLFLIVLMTWMHFQMWL